VTVHTTIAAALFALLIVLACLFQLALAAGAPWGHLAMGGKYPGRFPPGLRVAAIVQLLVLAALALVVLVRAGFLLPGWRGASGTLIWLVVAFSAVSALANLATPSRWERALWGPVTLGLLASSVVVALG
jgi:hypothetical protein